MDSIPDMKKELEESNFDFFKKSFQYFKKLRLLVRTMLEETIKLKNKNK